MQTGINQNGRSSLYLHINLCRRSAFIFTTFANNGGLQFSNSEIFMTVCSLHQQFVLGKWQFPVFEVNRTLSKWAILLMRWLYLPWIWNKYNVARTELVSIPNFTLILRKCLGRFFKHEFFSCFFFSNEKNVIKQIVKWKGIGFVFKRVKCDMLYSVERQYLLSCNKAEENMKPNLLRV